MTDPISNPNPNHDQKPRITPPNVWSPSKTQSSKTQLSVQAHDHNNIKSSHDCTNIKSSTRLALAISANLNNSEVKLLSGHHRESKMLFPWRLAGRRQKEELRQNLWLGCTKYSPVLKLFLLKIRQFKEYKNTEGQLNTQVKILYLLRDIYNSFFGVFLFSLGL